LVKYITIPKEGLNMKKLIVIIAMLISSNTYAAPYVEYKHTAKFTEFGGTMKTTDFLRVGYKTKKNFYFEAGSSSAEAGYKFKSKHLEVKGKIESTGHFSKHGLETEVRYTF